MAHTPDLNLLLDHAGWIRGLARRLVADTHAAEDLIQEIWVEALEHRPDSSRPVRGWLATVMRNRLVSHHRSDAHRSDREREASRGEEEPSTLSVVERASTHRDLVQSVLGLDEPYRSTILMRFFEDLSYGEIARRTGVTKATVNSRITRGLERLRQKLETQYGDRRAFLAALLPLTKTGGGLGLGIGAKIMSTSITVAAVSLVGMTLGLGLTRGPDPELSLPESEPQTLEASVLPASLLEDQEGERRVVRRVQESETGEQKVKEKRKRKETSYDWKTELTHSMPLPATVKRLKINTAAGNIELVESYSGSVDIDTTVRADLDRVDNQKLTHLFEDHVTIEEAEDGTLTIKDAHEKENGWAVSLKIALPAALPLHANTGAGNVLVRHAGGEMHLNSGAGNVVVDMPDQAATGISANSGAGNVRMNVARIVKGIDLNSGAGNVHLQLRDFDSAGIAKLNSGAGSVTLYVPSNVVGEFDLETGMGSIDVPASLGLVVEDEGFSAEAHGVVGQGGGKFKMSSGVGSIRVTFDAMKEKVAR